VYNTVLSHCTTLHFNSMFRFLIAWLNATLEGFVTPEWLQALVWRQFICMLPNHAFDYYPEHEILVTKCQTEQNTSVLHRNTRNEMHSCVTSFRSVHFTSCYCLAFYIPNRSDGSETGKLVFFVLEAKWSPKLVFFLLEAKWSPKGFL
jgi:hypothetical protein